MFSSHPSGEKKKESHCKESYKHKVYKHKIVDEQRYKTSVSSLRLQTTI